MELLFVLLALADLFLLCAFLTLKCRIHSALAPLVGLALAVCWLTLCAMADVLLPGVILLYLANAAAGIWALWGAKATAGKSPAIGSQSLVRKLFAPGAVLFWGLSLAFAIYFFVRQPMATGYDELSLWATAVKLTKADNRLYTTAVLGTPWAATQNPGLPLLSYFFSFLGSYADWKIYLAYDALAFAVFAAVLGGVCWRQYRLAVPLAAVCWCIPYFFTTYNHTIYLNTVYMSAYGDIPAGLVLGGAVALWLFLRRTDSPRWAVLPVLALCANIKANTFVLALVAAGLVAVDHWLFAPDKPFTKGLLRRTGFAAACFAAPMAIYYLWNVRYVGYIVAKNAQDGGMGETSLPLSGVVVNGIKILLGGQGAPAYEARRDQFLTAMADMGAQYFTPAGKLSMIGQGVIITALILAVFALAALVCGNGRGRLRIGVLAVLSLACFGGYNLMLALSYGFIFKDIQAVGLTDYNRYIYSYYIGWMLMAVACLSATLQPAPQPAAPGKRQPLLRHLLPLAGQGGVLLLALAMLLRVNQMILPQLSVLGFSDGEFADRKSQSAEAALVCSYLDKSDRVFFVSQGDTGLAWFTALYDFYPVIVDYSGAYTIDEALGGGGTFGLAELEPTEETAEKYYFHPYTVQRFNDTVRGNGCDYLYMQRVDDIFVQSYGELFTDGLAAAQAGETLLYRVQDDGFAPVVMDLQGVR